jgi:hypothetical protein
MVSVGRALKGRLRSASIQLWTGWAFTVSLGAMRVDIAFAHLGFRRSARCRPIVDGPEVRLE